jgi:hypothetical protein
MPAATRAVLRQSQFLTRRTVVRHSSSTSEAANKASQTASSAASKASEGLSKASAAAGPAISNAATALRKVGGPVGKVVSFVDCKIYPDTFGLALLMNTRGMIDGRGVGLQLLRWEPCLSHKPSTLTFGLSESISIWCTANTTIYFSHDPPDYLLLQGRH